MLLRSVVTSYLSVSVRNSKIEKNINRMIVLFNYLSIYLSVAHTVAHPPGFGEVMGSILGLNRTRAKDDTSCTYCCYVRCATLIVC